MKDLKDKKYYKPIYCYRHWPDTDDIYKYIIQDLVRHGKITLYEDINKAREVGRAELCDDDCYGIAVFDFTQGSCKIYYDTGEFPPRSITYLTRWSKCYEVIQTEVKN